MPPFLKQLAELWKKLSTAQKALAGAFVGVVVLGVAIASMAGSAPSWVLLKGGLDAAEVADALAKLDGAGVRRKVGPMRNEIYVDERDLDRARDVAAAQKLFAEGGSDPEWESSSSTAIGLTEEQRRGKSLLKDAGIAPIRGLAIGIISFLGYGLVLWAQTFAPIAQVTALRETSVVFGALIAFAFLREHLGLRRWIGAFIVAAGAGLIAFG